MPATPENAVPTRLRPPCSLALLLMACCVAACGVPRPSLVLVTVDTLRADRLGVYGYRRDTSPVLDRFAEDAVVFENIMTEMATTLPAHASLMTSTPPSRHGVRSNSSKLRTYPNGASGLQTLAQALAETGYATAAFVSAAPLRARTGIAAGFAEFDEPEEPSRRGGLTVARAGEWLRRMASDPRPLFLWVHIWDPHSPYAPAPSCEGDLTSRDPGLLEALAPIDSPELRSTPRRQNLYDQEVRCADQAIGLLLDELRALELYDPSAIVVTADHGESLGQHGALYHGKLYREQLHVPLIVKLPASRGAGSREPRLGSHVDLVPTLIGQLGMELPATYTAQLEGRDLLARSTEPRFVLSERSAKQLSRERTRHKGWRYALTSERWKLLAGGAEEPALFDALTDPYETTDLIARQEDVARAMSERLVELLAERDRRRPGEPVEQVDPDLIRELEALGYLGPGPD